MDERTELLPSRRRGHGVRAFRRSEDGLAAVEMALLLPIAMVMLSLAVAGGQGFEIQRRVTLTASTITGLVAAAPFVRNVAVSGATILNQSDLDTDLALSAEVMYPQSTATLTGVMSELSINTSNNTGVVVWSRPYPPTGTPLAVGTVIPLTASLVQSGATYMIYGQFQDSFQPLSFMPAVSTITTTAIQILAPRNASQITLNTSG
jgi:Flp pilus assembly protein TadG